MLGLFPNFPILIFNFSILKNLQIALKFSNFQTLQKKIKYLKFVTNFFKNSRISTFLKTLNFKKYFKFFKVIMKTFNLFYIFTSFSEGLINSENRFCKLFKNKFLIVKFKISQVSKRI